jgi:methylmalonyl-CoA/ethylmalonyl-CoA epimerase
MSINKIAHIAIAVDNLAEQIRHYRDVLGLELVGEEVVEDQGVRVAFLKVGESTIELLEPLHDASPVAKFIAKRGQGIHHIAFDVDDLDESLQGLRQKEIRLIDENPRPGGHGCQIAFLHPKSTHGVLTELCSAGS